MTGDSHEDDVIAFSALNVSESDNVKRRAII
jgi:hypothetical protein